MIVIINKLIFSFQLNFLDIQYIDSKRININNTLIIMNEDDKE